MLSPLFTRRPLAASRAWFAGRAVCVAALALMGALPGCGEDDAAPAKSGKDTTQQDSASGNDTSADVAQPDVGSPVDVEVKPLTITVSAGDVQAKIAGVEIRPETCTPEAKCPLVFVIGDRTEGAFPAYQNGAEQLAKALKVGMVVFNLPGQGQGANKTNGPDDVGGTVHKAVVNDVIKLRKAAQWVDASKVGVLTIGSGLWAFGSAYKTYKSGAVGTVAFLIDVEGPVNRCGLTQNPANEAAGIGPGDGPGATEGACQFGVAPQGSQFPPAQGNKPAAIVCSPAAYPILNDPDRSCEKSIFWNSIEPYFTLKDANYRYQRIQLRYDHQQPTYWQSRLAIGAIASSKSRYYALNDMQACSAPLSDDECEGLPCWLQGGWGNGLPPAPYAGQDWVQVTPDALMTQVIPGYLLRMLDTTANPNCK